jgi:hypothetical protein
MQIDLDIVAIIEFNMKDRDWVSGVCERRSDTSIS